MKKNLPLQPNRRNLLQGSAAGLLGMAGLGATTLSTAAANRQLNLSTEAGRWNARMKLLGHLTGARIFVSFSGTLWGIAPDTEPLPLCGFSGLVRQQWAHISDDTYRMRSFDVGFFSDLESGQPADEIVNPLTNETVRPYHFKYGGHTTEYRPNGTRSIGVDGSKGDLKPFHDQWNTTADHVWLNEHNGGEAPSPLDKTLWQRQAPRGNFYYGSEISYSGQASQLADTDVKSADYVMHWTATNTFEPWLLMDAAPGFVTWRAVGTKVHTQADIPKTMADFALKIQPNYFDEPAPWEGTISNFDRYKRDRKPLKKPAA